MDGLQKADRRLDVSVVVVSPSLCFRVGSSASGWIKSPKEPGYAKSIIPSWFILLNLTQGDRVWHQCLSLYSWNADIVRLELRLDIENEGQ